MPEASAAASQLQALLGDPEMAALIAAAPRQMGRVLRPLCRMLGIAPPPGLHVSPPQPRRRRRADPPADGAAAPGPDGERPGHAAVPAPAPARAAPPGRRRSAGGLIPLARRYARAPPLPP